MHSQGKNETDLPFIEMNPTPEQLDMIEKNYEMYVRNGTIHFEEPQYVKDENKKKKMEKMKDDLMNPTLPVTEIRKILLSFIQLQE